MSGMTFRDAPAPTGGWAVETATGGTGTTGEVVGAPTPSCTPMTVAAKMSEVDKPALIHLAAAADQSIVGAELHRRRSPFTARAWRG
jgi:hypothetical protein